MAESTYDAISTVTLSSAVQYVSITDIPQNYTDLVVVVTGSYSVLTYMRARWAGNDSVTYQYVDFLINNTPAISQFKGTGGFTGNQTSANKAIQHTFNMLNYSSSYQSRSFILETRVGENTGYWSNQSGVLTSKAPLTNFSIWGDSGTFNVGTTISVYGLGANNLKATGGDIITTDGTYWYHAFLSSGTFTPLSTLSCNVLVVAGGGGGTTGNWGGGSGAGGFRSATSLSLSTPTTVTVGAGGATNTNGSDSIFSSITSSGGGYGGQNGGLATAGGSGGGASGYASAGAGAASSPVTSPAQGNAGGRSGYNGGNGGGGAGAAGSGSPSTPNEAGGNGGVGLNTFSSWADATNTGASGYYAGGGGGAGGGGSDTGGVGFPGLGGYGGGGVGANGGAHGGNGTRNTGGGAGGSWGGGAGAVGGSGIVIVRYAV